uniref:immunoglobulin-like domain-containing protein n=1 Tax=Peribacillus sp. SI8-4 TaxID=3048009 RepID=UPI00255712D6
LPAGPEKNRLQDLVNNAQDLLNKNEQAEKDLNDAKNKVEGLFTDDKFDTLKGSTDQAAVDEAQAAINKLPAGSEKERLQDLVDKAKDLLEVELTSNDFNLNTDSYITGKFKGKITSLGYSVNGMEFRGGTMNPDGTFRIYALNNIKAATDKVIVYAYDRNGNKISQSPVTIKAPIGRGTLTADGYELSKDSFLTGKFTGDIKSLGYSVNGIEARGGTLNSDGTFNIYVFGKITSAADTVVVFGYDQAGNKIAERTIQVFTTAALNVNPFEFRKDTFLRGTYRSDVRYIKVKVNGKEYTGGTLSNGDFSFYVGGNITSRTDDVTVTAYSINDKVLLEQKVTIN